MRYTNLDKLFTLEGLIAGAVVLTLTVIICRPRKPKPQSMPPTMTPDEPHSASRLVYFADRRSPHEMRCALERQHMTSFDPVMKDGSLEFNGNSKCNGMTSAILLVFEAAEPKWNRYSLNIRLSWAHLSPEYHEYYRKSSGGWFDLWLQGLATSPPRLPVTSVSKEYARRAEQALSAEERLTEVTAMQQEVLRALRNGATFATAHKEGGTRIGYANERFFSQDYGESDARQTFAGDAAFLAFLRQFYDSEISRSTAPAKVSDELAWRLILRLLQPN